MAATAALLYLLGSLAGEVRPDPVADLLAERCLALGIDLDPDNPEAPHPSAEDVQALARAGVSSWLDAQLSNVEDTVAPPPTAFRDFLRDRHGPLWNVIAVLEKRSPEPLLKADSPVLPKFLPFVRLEKLLLATALVESADGNTIGAERALEASRSLGRAFSSGHYVISQILSVSAERWQAGVVRKLREVPLPWISRLSGDSPWARMLDALAEESTFPDPTLAAPSMDPSRALSVRAFAAMADGVRKVSPCELAGLSAETILRPANDVFRLGSEEARAGASAFEQTAFPNLVSAVRRAARLMVDRELTLKILELRFEKAASREGAWPIEDENPGSSVCPGVLYGYRSDGKSMEIRFEGTVNTPDGGVVLPLEFRSGAGFQSPIPTLAPSPTPTPTPTPEPEPGELDSSDEPEP